MNNFVEIEFKGNRRGYYANPEEYPLEKDDYVILRAEKGEDIGRVHRLLNTLPEGVDAQSLVGVLRRASEDELRRLCENRIREEKAKITARKYVAKHNIDMKLVSVEYQLDANKITFYFTADQRVDFRALVKDLAQEFKARIELRQIGVRDEARLLGGCGICGMELCCTTCITEFAPISAQFAKDQMLSPNPSKLSGNCGRLRCCLLYEQDFYTEAMRKFPQINTVLKTQKGNARIEKIDVFRELLYLRYEDDILESVELDAVKQFLNN